MLVIVVSLLLIEFPEVSVLSLLATLISRS